MHDLAEKGPLRHAACQPPQTTQRNSMYYPIREPSLPLLCMGVYGPAHTGRGVSRQNPGPCLRIATVEEGEAAALRPARGTVELVAARAERSGIPGDDGEPGVSLPWCGVVRRTTLTAELCEPNTL